MAVGLRIGSGVVDADDCPISATFRWGTADREVIPWLICRDRVVLKKDMSADVSMYSTEGEAEFPYKAISSTAIASLIFAVLALIGGFFFWPALGLAILGMGLGLL